MSQTFIKGKDSDLESTIATMYQKLQKIGITIDTTSALNPLPFVYSQHIRDSSCDVMFTNGKGTSEKSCLASALGEYFERLSCNYFFADYYLGEKISNASFVHYPNEKWFLSDDATLPEGLLDEDLWNFYDSEKTLHPSQIFEMNSGAGERGICALPFERQSDKKAIYFPINIIANLYVSNGMAAGNSMYEARTQALSEICERYVKNRIISEGISLPQIPSDVIARFKHIESSIKELESHGYFLRVCDASLGGLFPVISVTLINPKDASVFASFGAHPCFEVALERTVTELLQGRSLDMLDGFQTPSFNLDAVADTHNLEAHFINSDGLLSYDFFKKSSDYDFSDWNFEGTTQSEYEQLLATISDAGFETYISDYEHLGVYACRIIVPAMSEIYPVDDLVWSNNNEGAYFREAFLSLKNLADDDYEAILENLEESEQNDMLKVAEFIGIATDAGTLWSTLQLGELKAMLFLALKDYEGAKEWVTWTLHMATLDADRRNLYKLLYAMLEIIIEEKDFEEYSDSLEMLYSKELLILASSILKGSEKFYGIHSPGLGLEGFERHLKLLETYEKVHKVKALSANNS